jgi:WD40 repeat protein
VYTVAFAPDGTTLATGSYDGTVILWDLTDHPATPHPIGAKLGRDSPVTSMAFDGSGTTLATGSHDGTAFLWDLTASHPIGTPIDHDSPVTSVAFGPDDNTLATGSQDGAVILWDVADPASPHPVGTPIDHDSPVYSVAFDPHGTTLATGSGTFPTDGTVSLWDLANLKKLREDPVTAACQRVGLGLTEEEWTRYIPSLPYEDTCSR